MIRKRITFYGTVQGVGFRWRALHAARLYGCTGFVRNEWDGSVVMEIQGEETRIDEALRAVRRSPYADIERTEELRLPVIREDGFRAE